MALIYKVVSRKQWEAAELEGEFTGAEVDISDGFIHFSAADQVVETVAKHFAGQTDLLLVAIESDRLGDQLKWEESRGGALFPHLYSSLPVSAATSVVSLPLGDDGRHVFHDGFE